MDTSIDIAEMARYFQTALLFNVPPSLKRLSFSCESKDIKVLAVFSAEPKDYEQDCVFATVAEVEGHYVSVKVIAECRTEVAESPIADLSNLVFARYEANIY